MKRIAIFYHCLFEIEGKLLEGACRIITHQMEELRQVGLLHAASEFHVGINANPDSAYLADCFLPARTSTQYHGTKCRSENRTILMLEEWVQQHKDWYVLYFHAKGASHPLSDSFRTRWRDCMSHHVIHNWRKCVSDLDSGYDAVGAHWMEPPRTPAGHHIFAGTFFWANANFLSTLPSIMQRERIKLSGLDSLESRYESEVWIGNGPKRPHVKDYHPGWDPSKINTCYDRPTKS